MFGKVSTTLEIGKFQKTKRVNRLEIFLLEFYTYRKEIREYFVRYNRQFVSFTSQHYVRYCSNIFYIEKSEYVEVSVNSRIIIDIIFFRKINSNYIRLYINKLTRSSSLINIYIFFSNNIKAEKIKINNLNTIAISESDLIICS